MLFAFYVGGYVSQGASGRFSCHILLPLQVLQFGLEVVLPAQIKK